MNYKYFGEGFAFRTEEELNAWLKCFKGETFKGNWGNQIVVWTYKKEERNTKTIEEYNNIKGIEDITLCNGFKKCKRVYDDENKIVITYRKPYGEDIELDWRTNKQYQAFM